MESNPILVTSSPRSGSTWLGKMLTQTPFVIYIDEPLNPISKSNLGVDQFYTYINLSNE